MKPETSTKTADTNRVGSTSGSLFGCIVADPPWPVRQPPRKWKTGTVNEPLAYPTMKVEEIAALQVERLAGASCHLYLWTVNRFVRDAYDVAEAWGFTPSMLLTWAKTPMGIGPGRQYASTTEFALFAYRGPQAREPKRIERNWWNWPRGKHSAKPEAFQDIVESVSPGPYLELFARRQRMGWSSWGNEVPCDVVLSSANVRVSDGANQK